VNLVFVAGAVGGVVGYGLARSWPCSAARSAAPPARPPVPQYGRPAELPPTHPAVRRPALYDWEKDGGA
jgi:hypothetical protein